MTPWRHMSTAPKDRSILILTSDFGIVEARWNDGVDNFYKSQKGWASYDPENAQGDWVCNWIQHSPDDGDRRLFCGASPVAWMERPEIPAGFYDFTVWDPDSLLSIPAIAFSKGNYPTMQVEETPGVSIGISENDCLPMLKINNSVE